MPKIPPDSTNQPATRLSGLLATIGSKLMDNIVVFVVAVVLSVCAYFWNDLISSFDQHILNTVENDLEKDDSRLIKSIRATLSSEIKAAKGQFFDSLDSSYQTNLNKIYGEMTFGSLNLIDLKLDQGIRIFVPPHHDGVLGIQVQDLPPGFIIRVLSKNGKKNPICKSGSFSYTVSDLLTAGDRNVIEAHEDSKYFGNLYTFTLGLRRVRNEDHCDVEDRSDSGNDQSNFVVSTVDSNQKSVVATPVRITYIAVISPPIKAEELR